jgi:hypothetical protein
MNPSYCFRLPESFQQGEFLRTPVLTQLADDARYFISTILTKTSRKQDDLGYVRLMAKHLRSIMHKHKYNGVVDALLDGGAVERVAYRNGHYPFGYRLADRFLYDKHVRIAAQDPRLIHRLRLFHKQAEIERRARMKPVHFALEQLQHRLEIDGDLAREIIAALPPSSNPWDIQGVLVRDIENQDFHLNVGQYGRVTNNISSMKREVRSALRHGKELLKHVDIKCCQPALIGLIMQKEEKQQEHRQDQTKDQSIYDAPLHPPDRGGFVNYCEMAQSGELYDFLLSRLESGEDSGLTRDQLKKRFLTDVVAKRKANSNGAEYPSSVEDAVRSDFPSVYRFIRKFNGDGWEHENLIRRLQQEESKLVIETVAADLVTRHPELFFLTLHDAIFTTERYIPLVVNAFEAAFDRTGYPMSLKVE